MSRLTIRNEQDLQAALRRAQDLISCMGSDKEHELAQLEEALDLYACLLWAQAHIANDNTPRD
ncbi:hypothetical protein ASE61_23775 [Bosea sp. Root670]|uniref:hypothetical protein n=1 Tax=Bosea sp. Root670 TaxID=1736583 RepID=UPI000715FA63|nr:hypothetical protein [Bosea sp. Root670]KRE07013.1 hypothetical protein ASE61_23775 [Bosea sp. Root670]